jgi:hypothetical protein
VDPRLTDSLATVRTGLDFEIVPDWKLNLDFGYDSMSDEKYIHGSADIKIGHVWFLHPPRRDLKKWHDQDRPKQDEKTDQKKKSVIAAGSRQSSNNTIKETERTSEEDEDEDESPVSRDPADASVYYYDQRERRLTELDRKWRMESEGVSDEDLSEDELNLNFPQLRVIYHLGFNLHSLQPNSYQVPSKSSVPSQSLEMNQYQYGPEIIYEPFYGVKYHAAFKYFLYSNNTNVSSFAGQLNLADSARMPTFPAADLSAWANQLLAFPSWLVFASASWVLGERDRFDLKTSLTAYQLSSQNMTYGLYPYYSRKLRNRWEVGGGLSGVTDINNFDIFKNISASGGITYHY